MFAASSRRSSITGWKPGAQDGGLRQRRKTESKVLRMSSEYLDKYGFATGGLSGHRVAGKTRERTGAPRPEPWATPIWRGRTPRADRKERRPRVSGDKYQAGEGGSAGAESGSERALALMSELCGALRPGSRAQPTATFVLDGFLTRRTCGGDDAGHASGPATPRGPTRRSACAAEAPPSTSAPPLERGAPGGGRGRGSGRGGVT